MECPFARRYPSELCRDDSYYMCHAFNEALKAWEEDEVPIGAVICHAGIIVARAHNRVEALKDATAHAEILAITQATSVIGDWRLNECTLYVTKEPCPMCSGATIMSRIQRVVYACPDPKMGLLGGAAAIHEIPTLNHHPIVLAGVMEAECRDLIQAYFRLKRLSGLTDS